MNHASHNSIASFIWGIAELYQKLRKNLGAKNGKFAPEQIGYEVNFNKYFYQHKPLMKLETVVEEILQLEEKTEGLLKRLVSFREVN